ncbi:4-(cytidine 5'-diphospho)-2-C-methyl-D-erythritol kinase [Desulfobacterales bacterium HSG16]|nr:4-(cytidine 5'-diphospho)-2-C-methyl-D-erythritol kinase [Desulfobacterales bacterium HSG16]
MVSIEPKGCIEKKSPAKINLFLHITGKRPDQYHELYTLMCPVSLYDTIRIFPNASTTQVYCDHPEVPEDETNLAHRAARLFFDRLQNNGHARIEIKKKIPVAGGMGGGSSNAAAVLSALNEFFDHPFSRNKLMEMGLCLGADVPFFILGLPAIATGIGEKLRECRGLKPFYLLVISFSFGVSTAHVYKKFNFELTKEVKDFIKPSFNALDCDISRLLCNDLEEVTETDYPIITEAKEALLEHGAKGVLMSGSGPTVFGLFSSLSQIEHAAKRLVNKEMWEVYSVKMINCELKQEQPDI